MEQPVKTRIKIDDYSRFETPQVIENITRDLRRQRHESYRRGMRHGRHLQHKREQRDRLWNYIGIATLAFCTGAWLGVALTNGTW